MRVLVVRVLVVRALVVRVIVVQIAMVRISTILVGDEVVLMQAPTLPLVRRLTCVLLARVLFARVRARVEARVLARVLAQALWRLPPTHGICDESYLYQRSAHPAGKSGKCGYEFVCESPSVRMLEKPIPARTKIFSLAPDASESVRQTVISELL